MTAIRELLSLYLALAVVPLAPVLALTLAGAPWQAWTPAAAWAVCWYAWVWGKVRGK